MVLHCLKEQVLEKIFIIVLCYFFCRDESTAAIVNVFLAIFVIIAISLIILIFIGYKLRWIEFNRGKKHLKVK